VFFFLFAGGPGAGEAKLHSKNSNRTPALTTGIILVLVVVAANAAFSLRAIRQMAGDQQWVVHSLKIVAALQATLSMVTDAETAHRGYILTGDASYLEPFKRAAAEIDGRVDEIAGWTRDNPLMQSRIPRLRQLVEEKLRMSRDSVSALEQGNARAAQATLRSGEGEQKMDQIRGLIAEMLAQENSLLEARTGAWQRSLRDALLTSTLASLVGVVFVVAFFLVAKREVRRREQEARAAMERESWLQTTLTSIGDAVIATDPQGAIKFLNRAAEKLVGCRNAECEGRPITEVFRVFHENSGAAAVNPVERALREGTTELGERIILKNLRGEEVPIEDSAAPILGTDGQVIGVVLVFRDTSARRMAQESARRSEKLAATGRLAATIAHEINNPLEAATNFIYLARSGNSVEESHRYLAGADLELARAAHITRKALSFYRDSSRPSATSVASVLEEVLTIYNGRVRAGHVNVQVDCKPDVELVTLRGELVQIVSNLVANALDALRSGGLLKITAKKAENGITLAIADNGEGIPAANMGKIFEAFFTTKRDIGTGLGLWVVNDLVEKQGGTISLKSRTEEPERGTTFSLFLPSLPLSSGAVRFPETRAS
jgi:PAS domain S-box-containing protein